MGRGNDVPFKTPGERVLARCEAERDVETRVDGFANTVAARTTDIALKEAAESAMDDAVALEEGGSTRAGVGCVEERDETFVGVLLGVSG
jgi:hypothetical protein